MELEKSLYRVSEKILEYPCTKQMSRHCLISCSLVLAYLLFTFIFLTTFYGSNHPILHEAIDLAQNIFENDTQKILVNQILRVRISDFNNTDSDKYKYFIQNNTHFVKIPQKSDNIENLKGQLKNTKNYYIKTQEEKLNKTLDPANFTDVHVTFAPEDKVYQDIVASSNTNLVLLDKQLFLSHNFTEIIITFNKKEYVNSFVYYVFFPFAQFEALVIKNLCYEFSQVKDKNVTSVLMKNLISSEL